MDLFAYEQDLAWTMIARCCASVRTLWRGHLARLFWRCARALDLVRSKRVCERARAARLTAMMTALLLYGDARRLSRGSQGGARTGRLLSIVGLDRGFSHVSTRKRHLKVLAGLLGKFSSCANRGTCEARHVALDGTKIKANASKHKAMSYERMEKRAAELRRGRAVAERSRGWDAEEDRAFGATRAARSCPNGSPTRRSASRRSGRRRPNGGEAKAAAAARPKRRPRSGDKPRAQETGKPAARHRRA